MKHTYGFIPKYLLNVSYEQEGFCMAMNSHIRGYMGDEYDDRKHHFDHGPCVTISRLSCPKCGKEIVWSIHLNVASGEVSGNIPECCGIELLDVQRMKEHPLKLENFHDIFGDIIKLTM